MKNKLYFIFYVFLMVASVSKADAQYHITNKAWSPQTDSLTFCNNPILYLTTDGYASSSSIKTYYGDGTSSVSTVYNGGSYGYAYCSSDYTFPGTYTTKSVLYYGGAAVDSVVDLGEYLNCSMSIIKLAVDSLGTGVYDTTDKFTRTPVTIEVDYNGAPFDTITTTSGIYYQIVGSIGDVYSYKIINFPVGLILSFPAAGIIYDTIKNPSNNYAPKYFGFTCTGISTFDLSVNPISIRPGIHDGRYMILVSNLSCDPVDALVTLNFSPKYVFDLSGTYPSPFSASGNTITWDLPALTTLSSPILLWCRVLDSAADLIFGDTVQEHVSVTPTIGDIDISNNNYTVIDTVLAGYDPNEMSVLPSGIISAGTQLKYTVNFENTGNDTAFNISVYDTLSDNVDVRSLNIVMASAVMNIAVMNVGGHNIVKFDFPKINLLDSSHHGLCDGAVIFTVNANAGLAPGTTIFNHAGIFFDYNPVVMTDTVEDIIGLPTHTSTLTNSSKASIYPNPTNEELTLKVDNGAYNTMNITNTIGQHILTQAITNAVSTVNVKSLPAGMYYITLKGESGVEVMKFEKL